MSCASATQRSTFERTAPTVGLTLATSRHDIARAILEGLTFELLVNLDALERCGIRVAELVAVGGGAKSSLWLQLKADILGRPMRTLQCREAACLGAALLAGAATGIYASLEEAVQATVKSDRMFTPREPVVSRYRERFDLYQQLHPALRAVKPAL